MLFFINYLYGMKFVEYSKFIVAAFCVKRKSQVWANFGIIHMIC